jgi:VanZ family protein
MLIRKLWPAIAWALIVLVITGTPGSYIPKITGFWDWISADKIVHLFIFATLGFLILFGFREQYLKSKKRYLFVITVLLITIGYGIITEVLQRHVFIGRDGNMYDTMADAVGGILGILAFNLYFKKKNKTFSTK